MCTCAISGRGGVISNVFVLLKIQEMEEYDENGIRFKWKWILQHCHSDRFFIIFFFAFVLIVTMLHKKRKVLVLFPIACESTRITRTEKFFMKNHNVHEKYTFIGRYRTVNEFCRLSGGAINKWQNTRTCKNTLFPLLLPWGLLVSPERFSSQPNFCWIWPVALMGIRG